MGDTKRVHLVQIDPKVIWDSTKSNSMRGTSEPQRDTLEKVLDCQITIHIATKFDSEMVAQRIACAEVRQGW